MTTVFYWYLQGYVNHMLWTTHKEIMIREKNINVLFWQMSLPIEFKLFFCLQHMQKKILWRVWQSITLLLPFLRIFCNQYNNWEYWQSVFDNDNAWKLSLPKWKIKYRLKSCFIKLLMMYRVRSFDLFLNTWTKN